MRSKDLNELFDRGKRIRELEAGIRDIEVAIKEDKTRNIQLALEICRKLLTISP